MYIRIHILCESILPLANTSTGLLCSWPSSSTSWCLFPGRVLRQGEWGEFTQLNWVVLKYLHTLTMCAICLYPQSWVWDTHRTIELLDQQHWSHRTGGQAPAHHPTGGALVCLLCPLHPGSCPPCHDNHAGRGVLPSQLAQLLLHTRVCVSLEVCNLDQIAYVYCIVLTGPVECGAHPLKSQYALVPRNAVL